MINRGPRGPTTSFKMCAFLNVALFIHLQVNTIITLATPHEPVVVLDTHTRDFYDAVAARWNGSRAAGRFPHLTFVSVGGGERDVQVRSGLTRAAEADVNVITTDAPGIWVSTDHRCIVWCKQLVLALKRALFDSIGK